MIRLPKPSKKAKAILCIGALAIFMRESAYANPRIDQIEKDSIKGSSAVDLVNKMSDREMVAYIGPIDANTSKQVENMSKNFGPGFEQDVKKMLNIALNTYKQPTLAELKLEAAKNYVSDLTLSLFKGKKYESFSQEERKISLTHIEEVRHLIYDYVKVYGNGEKYEDQKMTDPVLQEKRLELDLGSINLKKMNAADKENLRALVCASYYHYVNIFNKSKNEKLDAETIYKDSVIRNWVYRLFN